MSVWQASYFLKKKDKMKEGAVAVWTDSPIFAQQEIRFGGQDEEKRVESAYFSAPVSCGI